MTQSKHTPAPWSLRGKQYIEAIDPETQEKETIFDLTGACGAVGYKNLTEQVDYNIKLVIAAPELLEALETYIKITSIKYEGTSHEKMIARQNCKKAIAKARGES